MEIFYVNQPCPHQCAATGLWWCRDHCKTNGKQNYLGESKSANAIQCGFKENEGTDGN